MSGADAGRPRRVAVLGGGVTGLTAAYRLAGAGARVTLVEASPRFGGKIETLADPELEARFPGFVVEAGPDSFVANKPAALELCRELGLEGELVETRSENRRVYVLKRDRLVPMPGGLLLGIPTRLRPLLPSPILSPSAKARAALDLVLPRGGAALGEDESLGAFLSRRLGRGAVDELVEPLLGGIFAGDVFSLSAASTFPQLVALERAHRSLVLGARRAASARREGSQSAFFSLRGGMSAMIRALELAVRARGAEIARARALRVSFLPGGPRRLAVDLEGISPLEADAVVVALPAPVAASLLETSSPEVARELQGIPHVSTATVSFAYDAAAIGRPLDAVGLIVPSGEKARMLAATFSSSKWPLRAPPGKALLRVFFGGLRDPSALALDDPGLVRLGRDELRAHLGIGAEPIFARVFRYPGGSPQPIVGHAARLARIRGHLAGLPGLHLAGSALATVGIPDCVRHAGEVAEAILAS